MDKPTLIETPTVFCSKKLSDFLGLKTKRTALSDGCVKWNGHLFYLDGRKCLIFMDKETSYSVVLLDIVKKDLASLNDLFIDNFIKQLYSDKILPKDKERKIRSEYKQLSLQLTDNDKSTIASINDCVLRIQFYKNDDGNVLTNAKVFINNYLNTTPKGSKKFYSAKDLMKAKITSVNLTLH